MENKTSFKLLRDVESVVGKIAGKKVILRLDLNVPIQDGVITDAFRIKQSLESIDFLKKAGAKIIIVAHLENKQYSSLDIVCEYLKKYFQVAFIKDLWTPEGEGAIAGLNNGDVAVVENIRNWAGEKNNDDDFSKKLSQIGDFYVNEAFSVSHREHSSIVRVPKFIPSFAGFNFEKEFLNLSKAFNPNHPYLFILGGAKFETKAPLINKFLSIADNVFVGGALANDLLKAKGYEIGDSIHSDKDFGFAQIVANNKLILPNEVIVENVDNKKNIRKIDQVLPKEKIWDSGSNTINQLLPYINKAKFILWNGPLGKFEDGYTDGTFALAQAIADASVNGTESVLGGGDTLASIEKLNLSGKFSFVSTAGGAMLDFLANETLVGIQALENSK